eukprot:TRINITY_DN12415_c0_g1_i1.p1 TRINITY_DN12415_c0_g1~~TRINITY_DN12415_c0_g1_i1.p1  ORF type:complete len:120 (+),score=11.18 TRINITY_DN12415_c0_g1_i1:49-408(+)
MSIHLMDSDGSWFMTSKIPTDGTALTVGSHSSNFLRIRIVGIADRHFEITTRRAGNIVLEALAPDVEVAGAPVPESTTVSLRHGDMIRAGPIYWVFCVDALPAPIARADNAPSSTAITI